MLCTAEMMYEHARLCIDINFKIEYWLLPESSGICNTHILAMTSIF